jgi:predicted AAA+ superfamily ATPase
MPQRPAPLPFLDDSLTAAIRDANPWWRNEREYGLPPMRRWAFEPVLRNLREGLAPAVVLRGPRQIGKSTLLAQIVDDLISGGVAPQRILRVQFDELPGLRRIEQPILDVSRWYAERVLGKSLNQAALNGEPAFLFFDEVQNLQDWAPQLKYLVDTQPVRVLVTGSSALRIEAGRDSLAGRVLTFEMGPLLLREIAAIRGFGEIAAFLPSNGMGPLREKDTWRGLVEHGERHIGPRDAAFAAFSDRGAYPTAQARADLPWEQVADFLNETVIRRAIQHDLRVGSRGQRRDQNLLEEVFRLAARYIGQSPGQALYLDEVRRAMAASIGWQRVLAYLKFLDQTLLLRLIEPLELRLKRRRGMPKICLCDHALRAAWLQERIPLDPVELASLPHLNDLAGRIAESTVGYFFRSIVGLDVAHFPERGAEPEVDFILTIGEQRIPVEVKYRRRVSYEDTYGLRSFIEKAHYHAPFGIIVTQTDAPEIDDPRIVAVTLPSLMLLR